MGNKLKKSLRSSNENGFVFFFANKSLQFFFPGDVTPEAFDQFYESLRKQLTEGHINQLQVLFSFVNLRQVDLKESLLKYLTRGTFKQVYKNELKFFESEDKVQKIVNRSLDKHCCSVLLMHVSILNHIKKPLVLEKIMNQIALSHCFVSNAQSNFKMHDLILADFIKEEFQTSMNISTHDALNTYMKIIGDRVQHLIEHFTTNSRTPDIYKAMKNQREHLESHTKNTDEIKEIYVNSQLESVSDVCLFSTPDDSELNI
ncbi:hypothetical protein RN001_014281 [Aquatica leii]|uniref:Uncharacterized protein n=1 Tax=Aquatica leii TaxID=1421715 RepID=A0AAN7S7E5_9COLE|nr:hypothetical protein RN001_014281 [Aquatica leii]